MKIIVLGGDGFIGWPLSLRLSNNNHEVLIIDNLSRRNIDIKLNSNSLTPIQSIQKRINTWNKIKNKVILFENIDIALDYYKFVNIVKKFNPDVMIHLAEQRSAPYSMKNEEARRYTVNNNLNATHNILNVIVDTNNLIHLIHLGTMGVYGYGSVPDTIIPEGYINVKIKNMFDEEKEVEILHPAYPGSIYHMTKTQDALFFQFFAKNYNLKITDLHQGIIWGNTTKETLLHDDLINRFDYDSDYGTVLNRFIMQSANNIPITIYGTGDQTRAFIHIENSMDCIELALLNPPNNGDKVKIFNQMVETFNLNTLAQRIKKLYHNTEINYIENPRKELIKNDLRVSNKKFLDLGLEPIYLNDAYIKDIYDHVLKYSNNINFDLILPISKW